MSQPDNAYASLAEAESDGDDRWAFGTGFDDPLAGVDTSVPSEVDASDLAMYCLALGDDALIMAQRLAEWVARAPELEEEVALANIGLDLLGQARLLLTRAAQADPAIRPAGPAGHVPDEDALAYFRPECRFRNVRLVEAENGDFGRSMARLLVFSTWRLALLTRLVDSRDPVLAAIAAKCRNEVAYHRKHAANWALRLGDGTEVSHERFGRGLAEVWPYVGELFRTHPVERRMAEAGVGVDPATLRDEFDTVLADVLRLATVEIPDVRPLPGVSGRTGRDGVHTEAMGYLLAEMQSVAREHPEATW